MIMSGGRLMWHAYAHTLILCAYINMIATGGRLMWHTCTYVICLYDYEGWSPDVACMHIYMRIMQLVC